jgi:hypothetical protein
MSHSSIIEVIEAILTLSTLDFLTPKKSKNLDIFPDTTKKGKKWQQEHISEYVLTHHNNNLTFNLTQHKHKRTDHTQTQTSVRGRSERSETMRDRENQRGEIGIERIDGSDICRRTR